MLFLKKYFWVPVMLIMYLMLTGGEETIKDHNSHSEYNLEPYMSKQSLDKKQLQLEQEMEKLKKMMLEKKEARGANSEEGINERQNYPTGHIKLPDGKVEIGRASCRERV